MEYSWKQPERGNLGDVDSESLQSTFEKFALDAIHRIEAEGRSSDEIGSVVRKNALSVLEINTGALLNEVRWAAWLMSADSLTPEYSKIKDLKLNKRGKVIASGTGVAYLMLNEQMHERGIEQYRIKRSDSELLRSVKGSRHIERNDARDIGYSILSRSLETYEKIRDSWEPLTQELICWYEDENDGDDIRAGIGYLVDRVNSLYLHKHLRQVETAPFILSPEDRLDKLLEILTHIDYAEEYEADKINKIKALEFSEQNYFKRFHGSPLRLKDEIKNEEYYGYFRNLELMESEDKSGWVVYVIYQPDKAEKETPDSWECFTVEKNNRIEFYEKAVKLASVN